MMGCSCVTGFPIFGSETIMRFANNECNKLEIYSFIKSKVNKYRCILSFSSDLKDMDHAVFPL